MSVWTPAADASLPRSDFLILRLEMTRVRIGEPVLEAMRERAKEKTNGAVLV